MSPDSFVTYLPDRSACLSFSNHGPIGSHDEILCERNEGSEPTVVNVPEHSQIPAWPVVPHRLDFDLVRDAGRPPSLEAVLFLEEALKLLVAHSAISAELLGNNRSTLVRVHRVR